MSIEPTIGRIVHYFPALADAPDLAPFAAVLAGINADGTINLTVSARDGSPYGVQNVRLLQDDETAERPHAAWMAYQKGQAAKHDAAPVSLQPIEDKIAEIEQGTDAKFLELGKYLDGKFSAIDAHLATLTAPPAAPAQ